MPICLPSIEDLNFIQPEKDCTISGWDATEEGGKPANQLQATTVKIMDR